MRSGLTFSVVSAGVPSAGASPVRSSSMSDRSASSMSTSLLAAPVAALGLRPRLAAGLAEVSAAAAALVLFFWATGVSVSASVVSTSAVLPLALDLAAGLVVTAVWSGEGVVALRPALAGWVAVLGFLAVMATSVRVWAGGTKRTQKGGTDAAAPRQGVVSGQQAVWANIWCAILAVCAVGTGQWGGSQNPVWVLAGPEVLLSRLLCSLAIVADGHKPCSTRGLLQCQALALQVAVAVQRLGVGGRFGHGGRFLGLQVFDVQAPQQLGEFPAQVVFGGLLAFGVVVLWVFRAFQRHPAVVQGEGQGLKGLLAQGLAQRGPGLWPVFVPLALQPSEQGAMGRRQVPQQVVVTGAEPVPGHGLEQDDACDQVGPAQQAPHRGPGRGPATPRSLVGFAPGAVGAVGVCGLRGPRLGFGCHWRGVGARALRGHLPQVFQFGAIQSH